MNYSWSASGAASGALPDRYGVDMRMLFLTRAEGMLVDGATVLDLGSGRDPVFAPGARPVAMTYEGLDISAAELEAAPPGAYDAAHVNDIAEWAPEFAERFDLILSWQVLEHVADVTQALNNIRSYLKPGGSLVMILSGRHSAFATVNRLLPAKVSNRIASAVLRVPSEDVFPAHYDRCAASSLRRLFVPWATARIEPLYRGAVYFRPWPPLCRAYLQYESLAERRGWEDLATHYLVTATR